MHDEPESHADDPPANDPLARLSAPRHGWHERLDVLSGGLLAWPTEPRRQRLVAVIIVVAIVAGAVTAVARRAAPGAAGTTDVAVDLPMASAHGTTPPRSMAGSAAAPSSTVAGGGADGGTTVPSRVIVVAAAGAVVRPGVYRLPEGVRVAEVIAAAGGLDPAADSDRVNLAAVAHDGERVYVPRRDQPTVPPVVAGNSEAGGSAPAGSSSAGSAPGSASATAPVNLNEAGIEQLDRLPGVGPATAAAIVAYRSANGPFPSVDDLAKVRGIGPAKLEQIRPLVTVG